MNRLAELLDVQLSPHGWTRTDADAPDDPRHWWSDPGPRRRTVGCGTGHAWFYDGQCAVFMVLGADPDPFDVLATLYVWRALPGGQEMHLQGVLPDGR